MICDEVEKLYKRYSKVLDIACVVEKDVNGALFCLKTRAMAPCSYGAIESFCCFPGPGLLSNNAFNEVMPVAYSEGTMYLVAGPPPFQDRICSILDDRRVPKGAIVLV